MSAPLVPSPLDYVGRRTFSFYPPIRGAAPNVWYLRTSSWSEVQVVNAESALKLWLSRQYVGGVSDRDAHLVVELTTELDFANGSVAPHVTRVIEMPQHAEQPKPGRKRRRGPALVVGIRTESPEPGSTRLLAKIGLGVVVLCVLSALAAALARM